MVVAIHEIKLVIFDLAGTTVKDKGEVVESFAIALKENGIAASEEQFLKVRGSSKRHAILQFIPDQPDRSFRSEIVYDSFRTQLAHRYRTNGIEVLSSAETIFRWLRERGIRVALTTGFDRDITELLITELKWNEGVVDAIVSSDDVPQGRPAPFLIFKAMERTGVIRVQEVANVGDTVLDLLSANNAGVRCNIGVLSGAHDRNLLGSVPHSHLIESIAELPDLFIEVESRSQDVHG